MTPEIPDTERAIPLPPQGGRWHDTGSTLPEGWGLDMLPPGWRPLLYGETRQAEDQYLTPRQPWRRVGVGEGVLMIGLFFPHRTRRALPRVGDCGVQPVAYIIPI